MKIYALYDNIYQGPHSHILMTGGGVIFLGPKFWPKVIFFGSMKDAGIFFGSRKKTEIFFEL